MLDERFARANPETNVPGQRKQRKQAVIDLALDAYQAQGENGLGKAVRIDTEFENLRHLADSSFNIRWS